MTWVHDLRKTPILAENHGNFDQCHASTLVQTGANDFLCAYMAGSGEGQPDMAIWLSRCIAGEWQPPRRIQSVYLLPHWNPVLHRAGNRIHLFYKVGLTVQNWYTLESVSDDLGESWSPPREAVAEDHSPRVTARCKILVDARGDWIGPCSVETGDRWDSFVDISHDGGQSWTKHEIPLAHEQTSEARPPHSVWRGLQEGALWETRLETLMRWDGVIQPTLWESAPGRMHALMRSTRGRIYRSDSEDYGESWRAAYATALPNNNSGIDVVRLESGCLVLVCNPVAGNWDARTPLSVCYSLDNGVSFSEPLHLETNEGEYSYPAIVAEGKRVHISYTAQRTNIVYATFAV